MHLMKFTHTVFDKINRRNNNLKTLKNKNAPFFIKLNCKGYFLSNKARKVMFYDHMKTKILRFYET